MSAVPSPVPHDVAAIDALLCDVSRLALQLSPMEPTNSDEEEAKVAANSNYNPRFTYQRQDHATLCRWIDELEELHIDPTGVGRFFVEARLYLMHRLMLRLQLGNDAHWNTLLYPLPPATIRTLARGILADPVPPDDGIARPFTARHLARMIEARYQQYGLDDWRVQLVPNLGSTNTDAANRTINVRANSTYTLEEMKRMVVHEVDTHVLRSANGAHQPYRIFSVGAVPSYLVTEEGLAVINEERMGYVDVARTRTFAGRVLAATRAATDSFSSVYTELRDYGFDHAEAFLTTKRVKRGLHDTSRPGGYIKDQAYLWGRVIVEEFVLRGGDLSRLYVGKVALEHLPIVHELGLEPPRYMPLPYA